MAHGTTLFCDDIRHEVNGKLTLVGCYMGEMKFSGRPPGHLPKFASLSELLIPAAMDVKALRIEVTLDRDGAIEKLLEASTDVPNNIIENKNDELAGGANEDKFTMVRMPMEFHSITFNNDCLIKVRAYIDEDTVVKLGALKVRFPS